MNPSSLDQERSDSGMGGGARGRTSRLRRPIERESRGMQVAGGTDVSPEGGGVPFPSGDPSAARRRRDYPRQASSPGLASGEFAAPVDPRLGPAGHRPGDEYWRSWSPRDGEPSRTRETLPVPTRGTPKGTAGRVRGRGDHLRYTPGNGSLWLGTGSVVPWYSLAQAKFFRTPGLEGPRHRNDSLALVAVPALARPGGRPLRYPVLARGPRRDANAQGGPGGRPPPGRGERSVPAGDHGATRARSCRPG